MGTWCWEAAHPHAAAAEDVALVCSWDVELPGHTSIEVIRVDAPVRVGAYARMFSPGGMISRHGPRVMHKAVRALEDRGRRIETILLNSTEFFDASIQHSQYVVAWARGVTLANYLA